MHASTAPSSTARTRVRVRRRVVGAATALTCVAGLLCAGSSGPAVADTTTTPGSASALSAAATKGSGVTLTQKSGTGTLGTLTGTLTTGLLTATLGLPNAGYNVASNALTNAAGLQAVNAATRQPRPSTVTNYPVCNQSGWAYPGGNCYSVIGSSATPTLPSGSLLALSAGTVQGYATGDDQGYVAASGSSHPILVVPGLALDLGVASSNVQCTVALVCTPSHSFTGASITTTAGTQAISLASGSTLASIGSTTVPNLTSVPIVGTAANPVVSATANGNFLTFNVTLSLTQYLTALGTTLGALNSGLTGLLSDNGSSITLAVTVGPAGLTGTGSSNASAWGVDVGVNLIADIKLNVNTILSGGLLGGLLGSTELVTTGASAYPGTPGSTPDLLDLKFAYSQGTAGALLPDFVPPGLI